MTERVLVKFSPLAKLTAVLVIAVLLLVFLNRVAGILPPFIWALIVTYIFDPLVSWIARRTRMPRRMVVALMFAVILGVVAWGIVVLRPLIVRELRDLAVNLPKILADAQAYLFGPEKTEFFGVPISPKTVQSEAQRYLQEISVYLRGQAFPFFLHTFELIAQALLFLIATFYLLLEMDSLAAGMVDLLPRRYRREVIPLLQEIDKVLGAYIRGQFFLIVIMSSVTWVALTVLRVHYALVLAIATGILEIFPIVGPITAGTIAVTIALFQSSTPFGWSNLTLAMVVAVTYLVLRQTEDYLVVPHVIGRIVELHPLVVLFALLCGSAVAGITGMFVAVPTAAVIRILARYLYSKFVGGPSLTGLAAEGIAASDSGQEADRV